MADINPAGILGMDFLDLHECVINLKKSYITVNGVTIHTVKENDFSHCCRIALGYTVTVQPGQEVIVPGKIKLRKGIGCTRHY